MKRLIIGVAFVIVLLAILAAALPFLIPADAIKKRALAAAREATGREVRIDGAFELDPGPTTSVRAEGVVFGNADSGSRPELAIIESLALDIEILPLLFGQTVIPRLSLAGADILLERDKQGVGNWVFAADDGGAGSGDGAVPQLGEVTLDNIVLAYKDGVTGAEQQFTLVKLALVSEGAAGPLALTLDGRWNNEPMTGQGSLPSPATWAGGNGPVPVTLALRAFALEIGIDGAVTPRDGGPDFDIALTVKGKNLDGLRPLAGDTLPEAGPFDLGTRVKGSLDVLSLQGLKLALGKTDLAGNISIDTKGARLRVDGKLSSSRVDLNELMPPWPAAPGSGGSDARAARKRVFPEDPLPLDGLKAADARIDIAIGELVTPTLPLKDVKVALSLENGKLDAAPFSSKVAGSDVAGGVSLDGSAATPALAVKVGSKALDVGKLLAETGITDMLEGKATLDVDLKGQGGSVAAIMASLTGHARLVMGKGRTRTESFDLLVGGLSQVMSSLFAEKSEWTVVECIAGDFAVKDGLATPKVMAVNTEHVLVFGEGGADFGKETLNMKLTPKPKVATLNVSVPIKVGGTFLEPTFAPDELATVRRLGGLVGSAFFPPAALLAFGDLGGSDDPCIKEMSTRIEATPAATPSSPADAVETVTKAAGKVLKAIGSGLKKSFGN